MDLSPIGRAALEEREDCRLEAYRDSVGVWTIACGVTTASGLIAVQPGLRLTEAEAAALNARAFAKYAGYVRSGLGDQAVAQHQFDALVSLCFNIGPGGFLKSTVLRRLRAGDVPGAAEAFLMWNKPAAVISRRQGEHDQFLTPYATRLPKARSTDRVPIAAPAVPQPPRAPRPDPLQQTTASQPALTGGLSSAPEAAPGFWTRLRGTIRTNMSKGA